MFIEGNEVPVTWQPPATLENKDVQMAASSPHKKLAQRAPGLWKDLKVQESTAVTDQNGGLDICVDWSIESNNWQKYEATNERRTAQRITTHPAAKTNSDIGPRWQGRRMKKL